MTTAHRPTWTPAKGGGTARDLGRTQQFSSRDLPGHLTLKTRQVEEGEGVRDFKADLKRREQEKRSSGKSRRQREPETNEEDRDDGRPPRLLDPEIAKLDADDPDMGDNDDDSDDSDDDMAELLAELERIKKERAAEQAKKAEEEAQERERVRTENLLQGNPLLNQTASFTVRKRWDDDVVFKNCARGVPEKKQASYVNDTIRSEFHRKFMKKYVQ